MKVRDAAHVFVAALLLSASSVTAGEGFAVIVHADHGGEKVSAGMLRDIYMGDVDMWEDNKAVRPCYVKSGVEGSDAFFDAFLDMSVQKYKKHWLKKVFSGYATEPSALKSVDEVVANVSTTAGGIGIIPADAVEKAKGCKVLKVE